MKQLCFDCGQPTGRCREDMIRDTEGRPLCEDCAKETYCSLCNEPGADKIPHPNYWPGEQQAESKYVHADCEVEECKRAHAALSEKERIDFLRGI